MGDNINPDSSMSARKGGKGGKGNVIKFGKAKKSLARQGKAKTAAINRARFGQKKSAKELKLALLKKLQANLDSHKIEPKSEPKAEPKAESETDTSDRDCD